MRARPTFRVILATVLLILTEIAAAQSISPSAPSAALLPVQYGRCDWDEARRHIDWVLNDRRARQTMEAAIRQQGISPYQAVLYAQSHSLEAQSAIDACRRRAQNYIEDNYQVGYEVCDWNSARRHIDWVLNDSRARRDMEQAIRRHGINPYEAILYVQGQNPNAQQAIQNCDRQARNYVNDAYRPANVCDWNEARQHIDWVLNNRRARQTMEEGISRRKMKPYEAVLYAQSQNADAQQAIEACRRQAQSYITDNYRPTVATCNWKEAREHIDWVLNDRRARRTMEEAIRNRGMDPYRAVLYTQSHNPTAQQAIQACDREARSYIEQRYAASSAPSEPQQPDDRCRWDYASRYIDQVFDDARLRKQVQDNVYYNAAEPYAAVMALQSRDGQRAIEDCYSRSKRYIEQRFAKYRL